MSAWAALYPGAGLLWAIYSTIRHMLTCPDPDCYIRETWRRAPVHALLWFVALVAAVWPLAAAVTLWARDQKPPKPPAAGA